MVRSLSILSLFLLTGAFTKAQNALLIPPVLTGTTFNLTVQNGTHTFLPGFTTQTMGVNGNVLGPTLIVNKGDQITLNVSNQIGDTTTMHWHGLHVAPENDGGPHTIILPGATWSPSFTVLDHASTFWYHPHLHHKTNKQVSMGIAGFFIVKDAAEAALTLPRTYGADDFPLCIQTKDLDAAGQITSTTNSDDVLMVNATVDPYLDVPAQVVRLRLLNGSSQRVFNLGLSNGQTFHQIGSDGGLLEAPVPLTRVLLSPGERAEILVNLGGMSGQTVYLKSFASEMPNGMYGSTFPGMGQGMTLTGYNPNPLNGTDFNVLRLNVGAQTANPVTTVPAALVTVTPIPANQSNITRQLTFMPAQMGPNQLNGDFMINNAMFDINVINYQIPLNNTEIWTLDNNSGIAHPFHIHDVQFFILDRNGVQPPLNERGMKDVVLVKPQEVVRFITKFTDFANDQVPYVYHCHMLPHEDMGMMGQFIVFDPSAPSGIGEHQQNDTWSVFPNPATGAVDIELGQTQGLKSIEIRSVAGQLLYSRTNITEPRVRVSTSGFASGLYLLTLRTAEGFSQKRLVVE